MNLLKGLKNELNKTTTLNGADAFKSTTSKVLDLFSLGGTLRSADEEKKYQIISLALSEDLDLGLRALLNLSDVRQGQGERNLFKVGLRVLRDNYDEEVVKKVILSIPELTRWDYVFEFIDTKYEKFVLDFIKYEIENSRINNKTSLLFKWLPSLQTNTKLALKISNHLKLDKKSYRQMLSSERTKLRIVEKDMSSKNWSNIEYDKVPSKASMIYRNAFLRNDEERYNEFIESVKKGEIKINAGTIYPHEIVNKVRRNYNKVDETLNVLWDNLPDYVINKEHNVLPLIDVSGSMETRIDYNSSVEALDASIGLGIYLAEKTNGFFKNHFLTFSGSPELCEITGNNIHQKVKNLEKSNWGMNTNFYKAFELILNTAIKNNLTQKDMPNTVICFSDMEFDRAEIGIPHHAIKNLFNNHGFELPQLVYWNLDAKTKQHPVVQNEVGTILVSGYSPTTLKYVLTNELKTPYELMLEVIMNERYNILNKK